MKLKTQTPNNTDNTLGQIGVRMLSERKKTRATSGGDRATARAAAQSSVWHAICVDKHQNTQAGIVLILHIIHSGPALVTAAVTLLDIF